MTAARYPGRCQCGARFKAGDPVAFAQGYTVGGRVPIILCPSCRPVSRRTGPGVEVKRGGYVVTVFELRDVASGRLTGYQVWRASCDGSADWCNVDPVTFQARTWSREGTIWPTEAARDIVGAAYMLDGAT